MLVLILPLVFLATWAFFYKQELALNLPNSKKGRESFVKAILILGAFFVCFTELPGIFHLLKRPLVCGLWICTLVILAKLILTNISKTSFAISLRSFLSQLRNLDYLDYVLVAALSYVLFVTCYTALIYPPNSWDAMTYHLPRAAAWISNASTDAYPTNIIRQIFINPFPSYIHAQLMLLAESDSLANLVQWLAYVSSLVLVSLICAQLGAQRNSQIGAAFLTSILPIGILEATGTLTDWISCLWLLCVVYFVLKLLASANHSSFWRQIPWLSLAFGLAICAKGTALLFAPALLLPVAHLVLIRRRPWPWRTIFCGFLIIFLINSPAWVRNFRAFGHPLGPINGPLTINTLKNETFGIQVTASNIIRNLNLQLISSQSPQINNWWIATLQAIHTNLLSISRNDPRTTWPSTNFPERDFVVDENKVSNDLHLYFIFLGLVAFILSANLRKNPALIYCWFISLCCALIFCVYLKWQPWHTRLHLPLFVFALSAASASLSYLLNKYIFSILTLLLFYNLHFVMYINSFRPLVRSTVVNDDDMFISNPLIFSSYQAVIANILQRRCSSIGIVAGEDSWEYPLWHGLSAYYGAGLKNRRIQHLQILNPESWRKIPTYPRGAFDPCLVVTYWDHPQNSEVAVEGRKCTMLVGPEFIQLFQCDRLSSNKHRRKAKKRRGI